MDTIINDARKIRELRLSGSRYFVAWKAEDMEWEIVPYMENNYLWFAYIRNGEVVNRINSNAVDEVIYQQGDKN